ncbi:MAG: translation initiation factor IF-3 [Symploca sp. SIO2E6]|nr:translation initiation factor IF-3 [Symploca sp. SIO2E6]
MPIVHKKPNRSKHTINDQINFPKIRVIDADGHQIGILTPRDALKIAEEKGLDLVLLNDKSDPPVCRVMDYDKFRYQQEKKSSAGTKSRSTTLKEVKMGYKIGEHDYQVRINQAKRFLKVGNLVKATVTLKGREVQHANLAQGLLQRMIEDLQEVAQIQQAPKREGRNLMMILSPMK